MLLCVLSVRCASVLACLTVLARAFRGLAALGVLAAFVALAVAVLDVGVPRRCLWLFSTLSCSVFKREALTARVNTSRISRTADTRCGVARACVVAPSDWFARAIRGVLAFHDVMDFLVDRNASAFEILLLLVGRVPGDVWWWDNAWASL